MTWPTPAPEPVGLYARVLPGHTCPHTLLNSAIAFCWAVEPSAVTEFLPPQSALADAAPETLAPDPDALELEDEELLLLPQAVSVSAAIAVADRVVPSALPMLLSFTDPTFVDGFELHGNVCGCG